VKMERFRPRDVRRPPFPFFSMLQNGPRRQGCAEENLFNPGKDSPPPRTYRAPLPAPGRSTDLSMRRKRGQMQRSNRSQFMTVYRLSTAGPEAAKPGRHLPSNQQIRAPPIDDVNNFRHDGSASVASLRRLIQIRRNVQFTSPEYAGRIGTNGSDRICTAYSDGQGVRDCGAGVCRRSHTSRQAR